MTSTHAVSSVLSSRERRLRTSGHSLVKASKESVLQVTWVQVDDPLDAIAVHAGCGVWGLIASAAFAAEVRKCWLSCLARRSGEGGPARSRGVGVQVVVMLPGRVRKWVMYVMDVAS